jgi:O-antigen/teichoic acid export membrane protein
VKGLSESTLKENNSSTFHDNSDLEKGVWRRFRRNVSITVVGSGAGVVLKLMQAILLTKFLRIDDYGRVLIVTNLSLFLNSFLGVRVNDAIFRFFQPFKEQNDTAALRQLLLISLGLCLTSALVIIILILALSGTLAEYVYLDSGLATLFKIFAVTLVVTSFSGIYEPILRLDDRFSLLMWSQVLGSLVTLITLAVYFLLPGRGEYDLRIVVGSLVLGVLIQGITPLVKTLQLLKPFLSQKNDTTLKKNFRSELAGCLVNSNLSGYLKFATSPGDIFLLGLFSSPTDVAWYGLAKQFAAPLSIMEVTIQTAITPEIILLRARERWQQLEHLIARYVGAMALLGGAVFLPLLLLARMIFLTLLPPQYAGALPVFYCLITSALLLLLLLVFRPLAVTLDLLKWHNLALVGGVVLLLLLIATHRLDSLSMAYVQLIDAAVFRAAFGFFVWRRLRHESQSGVRTARA